MALRHVKRALVVSSILWVLAVPSSIYSCGPFLESAIFAFTDRPDGPAENFAAGKLGIVRPDFRQAYLVVAYRYFSGLGLTNAQQKAALDVWDRNVVPDHPLEEEAVAGWSKARSGVPDLPPAPGISGGGVVPLSAITHFEPKIASLAVNHQGQFPSVTVSFNLAPGVALSDASAAINQLGERIGMPATIHGMFSGTMQAFQSSLSTQPLLIITALMAVYIVLGILYESYIHPITILSTLPSAGVGAVLALMIFHMDLNIVALIGIILLIGIVKKNGILMIDFALAAERTERKSPKDAVYQACLLRFRPILMTTMAALLGAVPLAFGKGTGSELRRPLGITIIGGLIMSQMLTLYTTPVVYLYLDRLRIYWEHSRKRGPRSVTQVSPG